MPEREEHHPPRRHRSWLPDLAVLLLVAVALAALHLNLGGKFFGWNPIDPKRDPALVQPPNGLDLPVQRTADAVAAPQVGGSVDPAKVAAALAPYVGERRLGPHLTVLVSQVSDGAEVYRKGDLMTTPASTMKLLTSAAALESLGPERTFRTTVTRVGETDQIVLVGGGDPFLVSAPAKAKGLYPSRASITTLATQTAVALKAAGLRTVRLGYDDTLFSRPVSSPTWPADYLTDGVVPPITALWVDEGHDPDGHGFASDPSLVAAQTFRRALGANGIVVAGVAAAMTNPAGSAELAHVSSAPVGQIVQRTLGVSDNNAAEILAHHVGLAERQEGSFGAGAQAVVDVLGRLGVNTTPDRIHDGSGLSRQDLLSAQTIIDVLLRSASADHPDLRQVITGLPVAGFSGSLKNRFDMGDPAGRGRVLAKTGTLTGVHGLAGVATDREGNQMVFVAIADEVALADQGVARVTIDKLAAALGACSCGSDSISGSVPVS